MAAPRATVRHLAERWHIGAELAQPHVGEGPILLANYHDLTQTDSRREVIYVEHGAGQTYADFPEHPSYSGGRNGYRAQVRLFLTLNERTAARERAAYPEIPVRVIGSPRLDVLQTVRNDFSNEAQRICRRPLGTAAPWKPVVAFCWHWRCDMVPETYTCWHEYRHDLAALTDRYTILGHGHPRIFAELAGWYEQAGIQPVSDFSDVVAQADVVCFDNTSAGYEAAALDIPVLALNGSKWRRDVHHGLRFWDEVPGPQIDRPADLAAGISTALFASWWVTRRHISGLVYPEATRGRATELAVAAILEHFPG